MALEVDPLVLGDAWTMRVVGAPPGAPVTFAMSRTGSGGTCAVGAVPCWDLEGPVMLGTVTADGAGVAWFTTQPDRTFPLPTVALQAWVDGVAPALLPPQDIALTDTWADVRGEYEGICAVNELGEGLCSDRHGVPLPLPPGPWRKLFHISGDALSPRWNVCGLHDNGQIECASNRQNMATPPAGRFADLDASRSTACALDLFGGLSCWTPARSWTYTDPGPFTEVDVGGRVCALSAAGDILCYDGTSLVPWLQGPFAHLSNSNSRVCGVDAGGVVTCDDGRGGTFSPPGTWRTWQSYGPVDCGLRTDGTIACSASVPGSGTNATILSAPPGGGWVDLQLGNRGACARNADGFATCWGGDVGSSAWLPPGWPEDAIVSLCHAGVNVDGAMEDPHHMAGFTWRVGATLRMLRQGTNPRMDDAFTFSRGTPGCPQLLSGRYSETNMPGGWSLQAEFHRGWVEYEAFGPRKVAFRVRGDMSMGVETRP